MQELSLHLLDLFENSVRAGASVIEIAVAEDPVRDLLTISVEDDGPGFSVPAEKALDPFYTTKEGKRTGLGLSLFRAAAEQAGGGLTIGRSRLGGALVEARLGLGHVDRMPLGDLPASLFTILCTNPGLQMICRIRAGGGERTVSAAEILTELPDTASNGLTLAQAVSDRIRKGMSEVRMTA